VATLQGWRDGGSLVVLGLDPRRDSGRGKAKE